MAVPAGRSGDMAAVFAALYAAHQVGDHWVQTHQQACAKGLPGRTGQRACTAHVATYTATAAIALAVTARRTGLRLPAGRVAAGLGLSALTHWLLDRRTPRRKLAALLGKQSFDELAADGINGAYLLDQSAHVGCLLVAALLITPPATR